MNLKISSLFKLNRLKVNNTLGKIVISIALISLNVSGSKALPRSSYLKLEPSHKEVIDQVWQIIYRDFLDSSGEYNSKDWISLRKKLLKRNYIDATQSHEAINEMLKSLNDPYTRFLSPKEFREMRIDTTGQLTGVGIQLSVDKINSNLKVVAPIEGTPAFKAGVMPEDLIISIDNNSTEGMGIEEAVRLIRGKKGTEVKLKIKRGSKVFIVNLIREKISINAISSSLKTNEFKIGYIRLKQFNSNSVREMRNTIKSLENKNPDGYILDLRSNPGGLLEASIEIARYWINEGTIVSTQTKSGIKDIRYANGKALTNQPIIVLVNQGSASASEILAGAIQDNERGILVGEKTFGKGLVQSVRALSDGSGLTVTIAKYLTPAGRDIHKNGIEPDINVIFPVNEIKDFRSTDLGTNKDTQYKAAERILNKMLKKNKLKTTFNQHSKNLEHALRKE